MNVALPPWGGTWSSSERKRVKSTGVRVCLCLCVFVLALGGWGPGWGRVGGSQAHPVMAKTELSGQCMQD